MTVDKGMEGRYLVLAAVATGYVSIMLAVSPISVALPYIATSLHVNVEEASWVMTAYLLVLTACLLPCGRLGDIFGYKPVFGTGVVLTVLSAAAVGFLTDLTAIVVLRALQGVGAAMISGTTLAALTAAFGPGERGRVVGAATVAAALGAGGGTVLTPITLDLLGWQGVFWLVVPVGAISLALTIRMPAPPQRVPENRSFDVLGAVLLGLSMLALSLSFNHLHDGPETFEAGWMFHTGAQLTSVLLLAAFVWVQRHTKHPLIRMDYLLNLRFGTAVAANGIYHMTMMATFFLTPFLFSQAWGLGPGHTAVVIGVLQVLNLSAAMVGGWLVDRWRWPHIAPFSLGAIGLFMLLLGLFVHEIDFLAYLGLTALIGIGAGLFNTANNTVIMSVLPSDARGFAAGMLEMTRQFGHTLAVASGAAALGVAGASVPRFASPQATVNGFQVAEIGVGVIAILGVALAANDWWARQAAQRAVVPIPLRLPSS